MKMAVLATNIMFSLVSYICVRPSELAGGYCPSCLLCS